MGRGEVEAVAGRIGRQGLGLVVGRPRLWELLGGPARVTMVTGPAGSGKTVLLRSWITGADLSERVAWVAAGRDVLDPQRFWLSVVGALRGTAPGSALVQALTPAPEQDGSAVVERLLADLAALGDVLWLVVDDVHELGAEALRQLDLLIMRAPPGLRFVLAARHDVRLGLHRLRLEGQVTELRAADLRFSPAEARELLTATGSDLPKSAVAVLHERTEGWAAGLRLAALAVAGHPDPARFATQFSGTERTVAEYLLAEVLERQPENVRRLLLRTSILERVGGELADLLTGDDGGERLLQDLESANAFVTSLDADRSWFRYHQLFAELLRLELRRTEPGQVAGLHRKAAGWLAAHGYPAQAVRQAQAARDWELAARLLAGHWPSLHLDGQASIVHELLAGFPPGMAAADVGLAVVAAADELARGSLAVAGRYLDLAERGSRTLPEARRRQARVLLGVVQLLLARQRGNLTAVAEHVSRLDAMVVAGDARVASPGLGEDLRALALISLGVTEYWAGLLGDSRRHLELGVGMARRIGRPYLVCTGLAYQAGIDILGSFAQALDPATEAVELAERHGWTGDSGVGIAYGTFGTVLAWQMRPDEAEPWTQRVERVLRIEAEPALVAGTRLLRGLVELARGRDTDALAALRAAEPSARRLGSGHYFLPPVQGLLVQSLVRLGETGQADRYLAELSEEDRDRGEIRIAAAALRLAQGDPQAATAVLAPVLDRAVSLFWEPWLAQALTLQAAALDALGDPAAAAVALERALDLAEPDGVLLPFLLHPAPALLERHARNRTAHAALLAEIRGLLAGREPGVPGAHGAYGGMVSPHKRGERGTATQLTAQLSRSELRVLRYLPTNLTGPEIARELSVSTNTVKTHIRSLYSKLGTGSRADAVECARALGLLAPSRTAQA